MDKLEQVYREPISYEEIDGLKSIAESAEGFMALCMAFSYGKICGRGAAGNE